MLILFNMGEIIHPNEITESYARHRIEDPSEFQKGSFRTQDIGREGHSKRIAGKLKTGKWATQSILIKRQDYEKGLRLIKKGKSFKIKKYWK